MTTLDQDLTIRMAQDAVHVGYTALVAVEDYRSVESSAATTRKWIDSETCKLGLVCRACR